MPSARVKFVDEPKLFGDRLDGCRRDARTILYCYARTCVQRHEGYRAKSPWRRFSRLCRINAPGRRRVVGRGGDRRAGPSSHALFAVGRPRAHGHGASRRRQRDAVHDQRTFAEARGARAGEAVGPRQASVLLPERRTRRGGARSVECRGGAFGARVRAHYPVASARRAHVLRPSGGNAITSAVPLAPHSSNSRSGDDGLPVISTAASSP